MFKSPVWSGLLPSRGKDRWSGLAILHWMIQCRWCGGCQQWWCWLECIYEHGLSTAESRDKSPESHVTTGEVAEGHYIRKQQNCLIYTSQTPGGDVGSHWTGRGCDVDVQWSQKPCLQMRTVYETLRYSTKHVQWWAEPRYDKIW